ncbi:creatininase family protein [Flavobacteriaceae bacterium]|nr:creatininase family protein [Flavobacteriaceae bacterium]MDC3354286.1 creatininase family protein [Flavobacteriaceae bacterium]
MKIISFLLLFPLITWSQTLPSRWDELTASDWEMALQKSDSTCILPIGILEKHGPHGPIGSDLIKVRQWSARATKKEYAVVFPDYFYGQINEAKQQYGTFSLPSSLVMELLEATCKEIGRNGFKKIIIVNGHGGNPQMISYFIQNQLEKKRDYAVYFFDPKTPKDVAEKASQLRKSEAKFDMHGGENETSSLLYLRPDLVKLDKSTSESGENQNRLQLSNDLYTAIWWYAAYPNHYAGKAEVSSIELGKLLTDSIIESLANAIKAVKEDKQTLKLQDEYFSKVK